MGFEPTTLRHLVRCSNHRATGDSMVSKGHVLGLLALKKHCMKLVLKTCVSQLKYYTFKLCLAVLLICFLCF